MKVTIYDVAREAGLSIATVSRVINGKGGVTPKSERKIRDAIAKLGYLPDASAQGLASSLVNTIGLVLQGSVSSSYYIQFLDGAEHAARERGFDVLLTSPYGTPEAFSKSIRTRHKVDGVLFSTVCEYIQPLYEAGFPICYAGHRQPWDVRQMHVYGGFSGYRKEALSLLLSQLSLRSLRLRALICGTPVILIRNGQLQQDAMRKNRYTIDELMEELREQGISRIEDVKYAVLENSGQLSVFPWTAQQPPTAQQLGLDLEDDVTLPVVLINDGRVIRRNLTICGRDENWLRKQLSREKVSSPREVFLLTLDEQGQVFCVRKEPAS